jgi:cytosine/adenosine deaminase-related metal-dependent hydrolase
LIAPTVERIAPTRELVYAQLVAEEKGTGAFCRNGPEGALHEGCPSPFPREAPWRFGLSPHSPYSVHPELLREVVAISATHRIPLAMHLAESQEEIELLRDGTGPFEVLLRSLGAWDPSATPRGSRPLDYLRCLAQADRALVVHGNYLDHEEIRFLAARRQRMAVVYCPRTHARFDHKPYPLEELLSAGTAVALGTDSRASSPDLSLLAEMRTAAQKHPAVPRPVILEMGTIGGARALDYAAEVGTLEPDKWADFVVIPLADRQAIDPHELLFESDEPVVRTYCHGVASG